MNITLRITVLTIIFFLLTAAITSIAWTFQDAADRKLEVIYVVIAMAPFLIYLVATDKLKGFKGGGIELTLRGEAEKPVSGHVVDKEIEVSPEPQINKEGLAELETKVKSSTPPSTLAFIVGKKEYYNSHVIDEYIKQLSKNSKFRYILFKNKNNKFLAFMNVSEFNKIRQENNEYIKLIESGDILNQPSVNSSSIKQGGKNKQALNLMDTLDVTELAVLDDNKEFLGTLNQDEIVRKVLAEVIREA